MCGRNRADGRRYGVAMELDARKDAGTAGAQTNGERRGRRLLGVLLVALAIVASLATFALI